MNEYFREISLLISEKTKLKMCQHARNNITQHDHARDEAKAFQGSDSLV